VTLNTSPQAVARALTFARLRTRFTAGMCDHVVSVENGLTYSGYPTAARHFASIPGQYRHGHTTPPPGGLVFWLGGSSGAGHVALSVGSGLCASTDIVATGYVNVVKISLIQQRWGLSYVGWTDAYYGPQGVRVISAPPTPTPTPPDGDLPVDQTEFNALMTNWARSPDGVTSLVRAILAYKNTAISDTDVYGHIVTASGLPLKVEP
jgi:hypothetical protein